MPGPREIAIIGGAGKMGRWLAGFLAADGKTVVISGRDPAKLAEAGRKLEVKTASTNDAAVNADIIILSVPIENLEPVLREISSVLQEGQLVIDVCSVKTGPVELMHRYVKKASVLGSHPLFGPGAKSFVGQKVVLTPTNPEEEKQALKVRAYLESKGAKVVFMTPQEHDRVMSGVLALSHFIGILTADTLMQSGNLKEMLEVSGPSFKLLMTLAESVLSEDPDFYASLQVNLPAAAIEADFVERARRWAEMVRSGDARRFAADMAALRADIEKTDPDFDKAYRRMYRINEAMRD